MVATEQAGDVVSPRKRLGAWVLDALIASVVLSPILIPVALIARSAESAGTTVACVVVLDVVVFAYLVAFDGGQRGATPGNRILGMRVVDAAGGDSIGFRRAALRRLAYAVGGLVLYLGWVWLLVDGRRQALHDKVARTLVVAAP
jgi:uncharacterized RDD family membrane protein YckC